MLKYLAMTTLAASLLSLVGVGLLVLYWIQTGGEYGG